MGYRDPTTTLEVEELRKQNEKQARELERYRRMFSVRERLAESWENTRIIQALASALLGSFLVAMPVLFVANEAAVALSQARAIEVGVAAMRSNKVQVECSEQVANLPGGYYICIVRRSNALSSNAAVTLACNENGCLGYNTP